MTRIMQIICEAIEDTHGRLSPSVYDFHTYEKSKMRVLQLINCDKHLDEKMGSSFVHVIDHKAIQCAIDGDLSALGVSSTKKGAAQNQVSAAATAAAAAVAAVATSTACKLAAIRMEELAKAKAITEATAIDADQPPTKAARPSRRTSLDSISSMSDVSAKSLDSVRSTAKRRHAADKVIDLSSASRSPSPSGRKAVPEAEKTIMPTPKQLAQQSSEISKERYSWEKYR